jgi:hypothetical protein
MFQLFTMDQREIDRLAETAAAHVGDHVSHDACLAGTPSRFVSGSTTPGRIGNIKTAAPPCGGLQGVRESQRPLGGAPDTARF